MACQFQMHIAKLLRFHMKTAAHRITDMVGRQFRCVFVLLKELRRVIFVLVVTHASPLMALIYLIWPIPFNGKGSFVRSVENLSMMLACGRVTKVSLFKCLFKCTHAVVSLLPCRPL